MLSRFSEIWAFDTSLYWSNRSICSWVSLLFYSWVQQGHITNMPGLPVVTCVLLLYSQLLAWLSHVVTKAYRMFAQSHFSIMHNEPQMNPAGVQEKEFLLQVIVSERGCKTCLYCSCRKCEVVKNKLNCHILSASYFCICCFYGPKTLQGVWQVLIVFSAYSFLFVHKCGNKKNY